MSNQNISTGTPSPEPTGKQSALREWFSRHMRRRRQRIRKHSLGKRMMIWLMCMAVVLVLVTCVSVGMDNTANYMQQTSEIAFDYAKTAAELIDGDRVVQYEQTLEKDAYYQEIMDFLNATQLKADLVRYYYVFVPHEDGFFYIWDADKTETDCDLGDMEPYEKGDREAIERAFRTDPDEKLYLSLYENNEKLVTALYPIFNAKGEPVAVVGVDLSELKLTHFLVTSLLNVAICILLVTAVFMTMVYVVFDRKVVQPISKLKLGMQIYRQSMDSASATEELEDIRLDNEIGSLVGDFIVMMVDVDNNTAEVAKLSAEQERIGTELKVATNIQADMLPRTFPAFPEREEFDLYASMDPAKEVGGDFYDFFLIDQDHLAMVIADVSGKGVPAALFMVISRTLIKYRTKMGGTPEKILWDVNNQLSQDNKNGMFVTVWMAILELSTGKGIAANAGHEHPVLRRAGGSYELVEYRHSPVVAFMKGIRFREHEFQLFPGDRLFVYTDGVPEAQNSVPELYGTERMLDALNSAGEATPEETLKTLKRSIVEFENGADQFDDITMLCLDYFGPNQKERDSGTEDETRE